jgi:glyoxylase-like metal-dependent hydrolase (beta-lactamase superfamily II)
LAGRRWPETTDMTHSPTSEDGPIDLLWMGREHCIAAWRHGENLIDCGPRTTLETLVTALGDWRPRRLLLTHIHFDHAGAAGALTQRWPDLEVWVHRRGARHLISPERLEASARRVFGDAFDERFGGLTPIPESNIHVLDGGETVDGLLCAYTPGHASHHLAFLDPTGLAFPGDVAGVRLDPGAPVLAPTPPPDIDMDLWRDSVEIVRAWRPRALALPHFGRVEDPEAHLASLDEELERQAGLAESSETPERYAEAVSARLLADGVGDGLGAYDLVVPFAQNFVGLQRWKGQRDAAGAPPEPTRSEPGPG